jgi:general secretion pathway protein L
MTLATARSSLVTRVARSRELVRDFGRWWLREFLDLFPQRVANWLVDSGARKLVLAPETDAVVLRLASDSGRVIASRRVHLNEYSPDLIDEFLRSCRQSRARLAIGLRLPPELVFHRSFVLPLETRRSLDAVIMQDLVAKTPFQLDDIHHAHQVHRAGDKLAVSQCVVRRAHVAAVARTLGLEAEQMVFIDAPGAGDDDGPTPIIALGSSSQGRSRWIGRLAFILAVTALLLAIAAVGTTYYQQQMTLDALAADVTTAAAKAKSVREVLDKVELDKTALLRLRAKRREPGLLDIWEEATRILPTHTWLSELRLSETQDHSQVVMMGFSAAAATLIGLLDQSAIFMEASLVGPIAMDPSEGKERFVIQAKLRPPATTRAASR